jgi:hypothetical protein
MGDMCAEGDALHLTFASLPIRQASSFEFLRDHQAPPCPYESSRDLVTVCGRGLSYAARRGDPWQ